MSVTVGEILWASKSQMRNDSELVYQEVYDLVNGITGIVCAPIVFALLAVVVCAFRAFKTTFQRLILYHIVITLLCECSFALQIQNLMYSPYPRWLCVTVIYLYLYCILSWYVYTAAVTNYLFLLTLRLLMIRGNPNVWQYGKFAECFCIFLSLALPAAYVWIPIRDVTYEALNCDEIYSTKWNKDTIIFDIAVLVLFLEALVVSIILCSLFCYLRQVYKAQRQLTILLKHFIYHTSISSVVVGFVILTSIYRLYHYYKHTSKTLSALIIIIINTISAVEEPLLLLISAVFQTLLSIRHQGSQYCQKFCKICCKSRRKATPRERPYMETDGHENQTNPPSNPIILPSHTYFSVPYTGAFTQVTSDEHYRCIGEHTPLISSGNNDPLQ